MSLRNKLIRLAYTQPQLREDLLPLLTKSAGYGRVDPTLYELLRGIQNRVRTTDYSEYGTEIKQAIEALKEFQRQIENGKIGGEAYGRGKSRVVKKLEPVVGEIFLFEYYNHLVVCLENRNTIYLSEQESEVRLSGLEKIVRKKVKSDTSFAADVSNSDNGDFYAVIFELDY